MKILANKDIRNLFLAVSVIWAASLLLAQGFLWLRYQRLSLCLLFIFLLAAAAIWVVCCSYFKKQNKIMEQAVSQINVYLDGDSNARIECDSEGELYRLFHSVNSLAAVLNAHADNELREKEFLKNTISDISHQLKTPLAALNMLFERLYEDNVAGKIDDARFAKMSKRYEQEQGENAKKIKALRLELKKDESKRMDIDDFLETVRRYTDATTITKRMVAELIDHIEVYHAEKQDGVTNQRVVIHYNCIGAFDVPDRRKIPEADIIMETRKGVALSYAPEQVAV